MLNIHLPTTDGRENVLSRYTHPEREVCLFLEHLKWNVPEQAPLKIYSPDKDSSPRAV